MQAKKEKQMQDKMGEDEKVVEQMNKKRYHGGQISAKNKQLLSKNMEKVEENEVLEREAQQTLVTIQKEDHTSQMEQTE